MAKKLTVIKGDLEIHEGLVSSSHFYKLKMSKMLEIARVSGTCSFGEGQEISGRFIRRCLYGIWGLK